MPVPIDESRVKTFRETLEATCPAEGKIINENKKIRDEISELASGFDRDLSRVRNLQELLSLPLPPPPEDGVVNEAQMEERDKLRMDLVALEAEIRKRIGEVAEFKERVSDALRQTEYQRRQQKNALQENAEETLNSVPAVKNLSAETVKEIKAIILKSPEAIQKALEKLDPTNAAGIKDLVSKVLAILEPLKQELLQRGMKVTESDMAIFAKARQEMQIYTSQANTIKETLKDKTNDLERIARGGMDPRVHQGIVEVSRDLDKPVKVERQRIGMKAP